MKHQVQIKKELRDEVPASDYVPFGAHVTPNLIKLRNHAGYLALWKVQGIAFETADPEDIKSRRDQLNNFMGTIGGGHYALWQHKIGRVVSERLHSTYTNPFCAEFDTRYYDSFDQYRMFSTELYVSIVFRPTLSKTANAFKSMRTSEADYRESEKADIEQFEMICKQVMNSLEPYDPTRLSTYNRDGVVCSALLQVYSYILNGVWEHVPLRTAAINQYLPASRLFFGDKNGMVQVRHPKAQRFAGLLDFQDYPSSTEPGMNNGICYGDYEYVETQSFSMLNKREALKNLDRQKKRLISTGDAAASEIDGITHAEDMVQSGSIQMGEYHYSLAIYGDSIQDVVKNMASAKSALEDGPGYKVSAVDVVPEGAWFAQLPGNWWLRPRQATISSRNFAAMAPMHNFPSGKRDGNPWGQAITVLKTPSGQPFFFNFHVSPPKRLSVDEKHPGNTTVIGTTGVGKTTLVMALVAFSRKVKGIRTVFFDKDRGAEIGIRAMGGNYRALIYGERTGFNPFQFEPTRTNIEFCKGLVRLLITGGSDKLTAKEEDEISMAVDAVFSLPFAMRRLAVVDQNLPGVSDNSLSQRLKKWIGHGDYAWVLDNPTDTTDLSNNDLFGFDYTEFLDRPEVRTPIMAYLLHVTEWLIDGRPFQYVMEEFWKPLMDPYFTDFALNKQKTIRKQFGLGIFLTQSPSDVLQHPIAKTMVEQSVTQIFLPNPRADHDDYVNGFKVSEQEFFVIKNLAENSRMFLVKQNGQAAIVKLDLGGMPDVINILSGALDNVALLEGIRAEHGEDPAVWIPHFHAAIEDRKKLTITQ